MVDSRAMVWIVFKPPPPMTPKSAEMRLGAFVRKESEFA